MTTGQIISAILDGILILLGGLLALGVQAGRTPQGRAHNRKLGLGASLLGAGMLASDLVDWLDLPLAPSVPIWILAIVLFSAGIWIMVKAGRARRQEQEASALMSRPDRGGPEV